MYASRTARRNAQYYSVHQKTNKSVRQKELDHQTCCAPIGLQTEHKSSKRHFDLHQRYRTGMDCESPQSSQKANDLLAAVER